MTSSGPTTDVCRLPVGLGIVHVVHGPADLTYRRGSDLDWGRGRECGLDWGRWRECGLDRKRLTATGSSRNWLGSRFSGCSNRIWSTGTSTRGWDRVALSGVGTRFQGTVPERPICARVADERFMKTDKIPFLSVRVAQIFHGCP